ncbi:phosphodiester glycosidase family protein [Nocardioides rubriscoriae]|uniref:phosphodiester glycosidase family protein n=1 Tax=Nocardioides rubriscoriae TaxID=642762 RepID=UPI0011DFFB7F|nr:phosphodiester glycosidase family protein [Nocardioides rubriscoriae]
MRPFPPLAVLSCLLALSAPLVVPAGLPGAVADQARPSAQPVASRGTGHLAGDDDGPDGYVQGTRKPQTSDGVIGPAARDLPPLLRGTERPARPVRRFRVVPGVTVTRWDEGSARGPVRFSLMTVKYRTPGLTVDYADPGRVGRTAPVASMVARDGAVAGVNGDFFDIGRTGAPLGLGRDRRRGLVHGRLAGWNSAFSFGRGGWPDIGPLATHVRVREHPGLTVATLNSPNVKADQVGAYTPVWGEASGYAWTEGQRRGVRLVQVLKGRVVFTGTKLPDDRPFRGTLLVGRGAGARALTALKRGSRATVSSYVDGQPRMAITGNAFLVRDGLITAVDDREMHPRTAIGIDRDTKSLLLLVVDGRQSFSRGYTMVELADTMIDLGADEALNLDGGGSSTMVARRRGALRVVNSPSDGFARSVANAIAIRYRAPR